MKAGPRPLIGARDLAAAAAAHCHLALFRLAPAETTRRMANRCSAQPPDSHARAPSLRIRLPRIFLLAGLALRGALVLRAVTSLSAVASL